MNRNPRTKLLDPYRHFMENNSQSVLILRIDNKGNISGPSDFHFRFGGFGAFPIGQPLDNILTPESSKNLDRIDEFPARTTLTFTKNPLQGLTFDASIYQDISGHILFLEPRLLTRDKIMEQMGYLNRELSNLNRRLGRANRELKKKNEEFATLLREKELLISELNHRTKNNLQLISSILYIQSVKTSDMEAKTILDQCRSRIQSVSYFYDTLSLQREIGRVEVGRFLKTLAEGIVQTYCFEEQSIKLQCNFEEAQYSTQTTVSLGLIQNELLINAIKHGFAGNRELVLEILGRNAPENFYTISFKDNGPGIPDGFDLNKNETLGMRIVESLVSQIDGEISVANQNGAVFTLLFPLEED